MKCPYCNNDDTNVLESRGIPGSEAVRRRRQCKKCNKRFTTHEKVVNIDLKVIKKSGKIEQYDRDKLLKGVGKACYKRRVTDEEIENLVDEVECRLLNRKAVEIKSSDIGKMVLNRLKRLDELAYLRFASVYMDFNNAEEYKQFISAPSKITNHV
ncbi:transcriptional regulator NrdR [Candidatus Collierbacteria bacterium RIFOXYB2_FULL_46_14]|nr:MAG: transcriptional regulator NrdR [Candidatus Collierbacteria bacterium RIFOXYB2_FULL_46_14]OGD75655.1 MAG: transcriptional regulator NrdR [Candidatus Collierbacteria bacterium RIFOXYA2_FULL_46_20]OGD76991.1 MAG: transcriptional regulator NrdR [Candidatus Collierbacteria bacterium RIFOXYC2_FULL_43_15]OGD80281.1 MAG: transcriptional regulator NrdR [Pseudomonadales bacterium GWC2_63_15]OGD81713.1 MAG: transcriptional regulator NrdR [Candidatus Collierbacteria bacterium RIFOXYD2_FULL_45_13]